MSFQPPLHAGTTVPVEEQSRRDGNFIVYDNFGKAKFVEKWDKAKPQPDGVVGKQQVYSHSEEIVGEQGYIGT